MSIRIVTHCYASQLEHFACFLQYQMSSLVLYRPLCQVVYELVCTPGDTRTAAVLQWFRTNTDIDATVRHLPEGSLWRRSIGRNLAALGSTEEIIWFCDVDYYFGNGCLDHLWNLWQTVLRNSHNTIFYPREVLISRDHATGDRAARDARPRLMEVETSNFVPHTHTRAIGGIQVVRGSTARTIGYLRNSTRYQSPAGRPFPSFKDDVRARAEYRAAGGEYPISIPSLYRQRHSTSSYRDEP